MPERDTGYGCPDCNADTPNDCVCPDTFNVGGHCDGVDGACHHLDTARANALLWKAEAERYRGAIEEALAQENTHIAIAGERAVSLDRADKMERVLDSALASTTGEQADSVASGESDK